MNVNRKSGIWKNVNVIFLRMLHFLCFYLLICTKMGVIFVCMLHSLSGHVLFSFLTFRVSLPYRYGNAGEDGWLNVEVMYEPPQQCVSSPATEKTEVSNT